MDISVGRVVSLSSLIWEDPGQCRQDHSLGTYPELCKPEVELSTHKQLSVYAIIHFSSLLTVDVI